MNTEDIRQMIKKHEGCVLEVYNDTEGIPTVGYGHALLPGSKITLLVADILFNYDYETAVQDYNRFCAKYNISVNYTRKSVLINMFFIGYSRVCGFKKMVAALQRADYSTAAMEMLDSKWANKQAKGRAYELARIMEKGEVIE